MVTRNLIELLAGFGCTPEETGALVDVLPERVSAILGNLPAEGAPTPPSAVDCLREREVARGIAFLPSYASLEGRIINKLEGMIEEAQCPAELLGVAKTIQTLRSSGVPISFSEDAGKGEGITVQILNAVQ